MEPSINVTLTSKRDGTIDTIKGFAIIAVVLLHINFTFSKYAFVNSYSILGGLWHVAVFFVVSGWFLKDERLLNFGTFAKGKIINLYLKAMWVYIPFVLLHNVFLRTGWLYSDFEYNHGTVTSYSPLQALTHIGYQFLFTQREPFSGAMWFIDSLFGGLLIYSIITIIVSRLFKSLGDKGKKLVRFAVCFCLAFASAILRDCWNINLPKVSNTLSVLVLICIGQTLGQLKLKFDNKLLLLLSSLVFFQYTALTPVVNLSNNEYKDVIFLIAASVSALYVLGYIAKRINKTAWGGVIQHIGKESFWVMGLHMVGFHVFTTILLLFGFEFDAHLTTPKLGHNLVLLCGYLAFGVGIPLLIRYICYNKIYRTFIKKNR